jgi:hypothetical protein
MHELDNRILSVKCKNYRYIYENITHSKNSVVILFYKFILLAEALKASLRIVLVLCASVVELFFNNGKRDHLLLEK